MRGFMKHALALTAFILVLASCGDDNVTKPKGFLGGVAGGGGGGNGTITGVTAGTSMSGGGASGTVTLNVALPATTCTAGQAETAIGADGTGTCTTLISGTNTDLTAFTGANTIGNYAGAASCSAGSYFSGLSAAGASTCTAAGATNNGTTTTIGGQVLVTNATGATTVPGLLSMNGDALITNNASPSTPSAGTARVYGESVGGRTMLGVLGPAGLVQVAQPMLGMRSVLIWMNAASNLLTTIGDTPGTTGTATARAQASTNLLTSAKRVGFVSTAGAGSVAGIRAGSAYAWRGNAAGLGGFNIVIRFAVSDAVIVTTGRTFAGISTSGAPTDVDPSTLINTIGIGCDTSDTTLQLYASGGVAQTRTSLGASFPINVATNGDVYEIDLYAAPNASTVTYRVTRMNTGNVATGTISVAANLPSSTTFMQMKLWRSNATTAAAVGIDLLSAYAESDF